MVEILHLLLLIIVANGAPILARVVLKNRFNLAVDLGVKFFDDEPVFGRSKTWRGILAALLATSIAAWLTAYSLQDGLLVAAYAIAGDLSASFIKRRLRLPASSMAPLLDQVPESLLPAYMMMQVFGLDLQSVMILVLIFIISELALSHILFRWGLRERPY
jgi:CDP-2,3-bis-(O-geranylgeranyl)-sn-glycerol synthase